MGVKRGGSRLGRLRLLWFIPTLLWMVFIFGMSGQSGEESASLSIKVTEQVVEVIETVRGGDEADRVRLIELLHLPIRKAAHMFEYFVLAVLLMLSFSSFLRGMTAIAMSIPACFLYAGIDETHQRFVSGRGGQFADVCIDMLGVTAAVFFALLILPAWQSFADRRGTMGEKR